MKLILSLLLSSIITIGSSQTVCDTVTNKILMIGDSWSNFPVGFGTFENNLDRFGFTNVGMHSNTTDLSINGATTHTFLQRSAKTTIQAALTANPHIDIVNLSIGGNDILNTWNNTMDSITTDSLLNATMKRVDSIIDYIQIMKPGIVVYLAGYDFANFGEVIPTSLLPASHPFNARWQAMGTPNFIEMNTLLTRASVKFQELANTDYKVYYSPTIGLMQYLHGQTTTLGVAPGGTYLPKSVPFPGGRLDYPTPQIKMNDYVIFKDCFHLNSSGYDELYQYHFESFYFDFLRSKVDLSLVSEGGTEDGGVSSIGNTATANVTIGNSTSTGIYKGITSFNTSSIPGGTAIHKASIFLHRDNQTGTLPNFNQVFLEIKQGDFGTSSTVEASDYSSVSSKSDTACTYGTVKENGFWLRIDIPADLLTEINSSGNTQFRISMLDSTNGSTFYFSTGDSSHKPLLDLEYFNPVSVKEKTIESTLVLFPNPSNGEFVYMNNAKDFKGTITALDVSGRRIPLTYSNSQISISSLSSGTYFLMFESENEQFVKRFVKTSE